jgi:hypothetical protein
VVPRAGRGENALVNSAISPVGEWRKTLGGHLLGVEIGTGPGACIFFSKTGWRTAKPDLGRGLVLMQMTGFNVAARPAASAAATTG